METATDLRLEEVQLEDGKPYRLRTSALTDRAETTLRCLAKPEHPQYRSGRPVNRNADARRTPHMAIALTIWGFRLRDFRAARAEKFVDEQMQPKIRPSF